VGTERQQTSLPPPLATSCSVGGRIRATTLTLLLALPLPLPLLFEGAPGCDDCDDDCLPRVAAAAAGGAAGRVLVLVGEAGEGAAASSAVGGGGCCCCCCRVGRCCRCCCCSVRSAPWCDLGDRGGARDDLLLLPLPPLLGLCMLDDDRSDPAAANGPGPVRTGGRSQAPQPAGTLLQALKNEWCDLDSSGLNVRGDR